MSQDDKSPVREDVGPSSGELGPDRQDPSELRGLTEEEVAERVAAGKVNANTDVRTKSVGQIVRERTFTPFNAINIVLALLVAYTGRYRNMLFFIIAVANWFIGVVQDLRAKHLVDKLTILTKKDVTVIRAEGEKSVPSDELVTDDLIRLAHGDQIPADSVIVQGYVSIDESLLTGESKPVSKAPGDELMSGSFVDAGSLVARVTRVGAEGYAARISSEAKHDKKVNSEISDTLNSIVSLGIKALIPLGILLFLRTVFMDGSSVNDAILSTVSAVLGMVPQGLVLLVSSILALATIRLGMQKVLVQQSYCIETLARVDVLCLDKTGTITTGEMEYSRAVQAPGVGENELMAALAAVVGANRDDANETASAILEHLDEIDVAMPAVSRAVSFSSARKYSGCVTADGHAYVMGAAGFVLGTGGRDAQAELADFDECERVLVVAEAAGFGENDALVGPVRLLGCVAIRDEIREAAPETMAEFVREGVELRVISGDDPRTVAAVARRAGVPNADLVVDASTLKTEEELLDAVRRYRVFGRVTPQQKRDLVQALHADGHVVAMTGDGVNDVLALRESDCAISVASGSAAARNISDIVLADNDFSHMTSVVDEGRRSINNLQRSSSLFLVKTVFSMALAVICIFLPPYPFVPIQVSLVSSAAIGIPSFILALEPNHERVRGDFLANVLARSLPASAAIVFVLFAALLIGRAASLSFDEISTICTILLASVSIALVWQISRPLTQLRVALLVVVVSIVACGCTVFANWFEMATLSPIMLAATAAGCVAAVAFFNWGYKKLVSEYEGNELFGRIVRKVEGKE